MYIETLTRDEVDQVSGGDTVISGPNGNSVTIHDNGDGTSTVTSVVNNGDGTVTITQRISRNRMV